jgi:hypothetical protein
MARGCEGIGTRARRGRSGPGFCFSASTAERIERKKVEVEYLRRALDAIEIPVGAPQQLEAASSRRPLTPPLNLTRPVAHRHPGNFHVLVFCLVKAARVSGKR